MDHELEYEKLGGMPRSGKWPTIRDRFLLGKRCAICGATENLQAHHVLPFHMRPDLELDPKNLVPLCEGNPLLNCHLVFGHFGNFANKFNPHIKRESKRWLSRFSAKIMVQGL